MISIVSLVRPSAKSAEASGNTERRPPNSLVGVKERCRRQDKDSSLR